MKRILFVCTGNICRSPSAEAVFRHFVEQEERAAEFCIDSAGTHGYHVGKEPDSRAIAIAEAHGISMQGIKARQVGVVDFEEFDSIIAMDQGHFDFLEEIRPSGAKATLSLFMDFSDDQKGEDVPDPYYGEDEGFEVVLNMLKAGAIGLLRDVS